MHEVIGRPRAGNLHLAIAQGGAGGGELVLVALHALAIDQVGNIQDHLPALGEPAADFLIQRIEEPVHLETDGPRACLALSLPHRILSQAGQVLAAHSLGRHVLGEFVRTAVVHKNLEVHLGLAAQLIDVHQELALVGANRLAEAFIIGEDGSETEGKNGGMLEAIGDDPGMIDARFLAELFGGVVFADDNGKVTGGVEKNLIAADSVDGFEGDWFAVTGQFRKCLLFTDAVGIPCHNRTLLRERRLAPLVGGTSVNSGTTACWRTWCRAVVSTRSDC